MNRRNFLKTLLFGTAAAATAGFTLPRLTEEVPKPKAIKPDGCYVPSLAKTLQIKTSGNVERIDLTGLPDDYRYVQVIVESGSTFSGTVSVYGVES